jgi:hypothetical protein
LYTSTFCRWCGVRTGDVDESCDLLPQLSASSITIENEPKPYEKMPESESDSERERERERLRGSFGVWFTWNWGLILENRRNDELGLYGKRRFGERLKQTEYKNIKIIE